MAFTYEKDEQNIVTVTMDMDGRSANVLNEELTFKEGGLFHEGFPRNSTDKKKR